MEVILFYTCFTFLKAGIDECKGVNFSGVGHLGR